MIRDLQILRQAAAGYCAGHSSVRLLAADVFEGAVIHALVLGVSIFSSETGRSREAVAVL
jgi:hypothetical protein